ncbi:MAG: acylphosphatase [Desulfuromonas sp.]|nr:acylphosphatase [Desulfuromonas sp.]
MSGRVQGVWYRRFTQQTAQAHGVNGWVKNLVNGHVAALLEGEKQAVNAVLNECRKGSQNAHVEHIELEIQEFQGEFSDFAILR